MNHNSLLSCKYLRKGCLLIFYIYQNDVESLRVLEGEPQCGQTWATASKVIFQFQLYHHFTGLLEVVLLLLLSVYMFLFCFLKRQVFSPYLLW